MKDFKMETHECFGYTDAYKEYAQKTANYTNDR